MKKLLPLFLCLFFLKNVFVRAQYTKISGHVVVRSMSQLDTALLSGAEIILTVNDSIKLMSLSDNKGYYEFNIQPFKGTATLHCNINKQTKSINKKISCLINNSDHRTINLNKTQPTNYTADFEVKQGCCLPNIPEINFKENSLEFETDTLLVRDKPEDMINGLFAILKDNPTIVIRLDAHCDVKEKNKDVLSAKRADLLQNILIKKGIENGRLKALAWADKKPLNTEQTIKSAKSAEERKALRCKNRRIDFRVQSFDYGVKEGSNQNKTTDPDEE